VPTEISSQLCQLARAPVPAPRPRNLVFLLSGDAALTRRAKKASTLSAVVVRWSKSRKRYERQGLLVEEPALEQAEEQCLADSDARMRRRERDAERRGDEDLELQARFVADIARLFPGCPAERAEAIARHTALRGSGRVGRSAAGRSRDEKAVTLAVMATPGPAEVCAGWNVSPRC